MLGGDLLEEIRELCDEQDRLYEQWEQRVRIAAEEEAAYQILMRKQAMLEREAGVPATLISQFIRGDENVAEARRKRDIAEELKEISQNRITDIRKRIEITNAQAGREWSRRDDSVPASVDWLE